MDKKTEIFKGTDGLHIRRSQDATHIRAANKEAQVHGQEKDMKFARRFASIPEIILEKWMEEGIDYRRINKDPVTRKRFMEKLNSPEFRAFRTHTGKL